MATRRQEKVASVVKEVVSEAIAHHLNDPRIEGFVSVTRVEMGTDLRNADVYLSVFGENEKVQKKTFHAIEHAQPRIQAMVAGRFQSKFCPVLHFHMDEKFKKTLDIMRLIDRAAKEYKDKDESDDSYDAIS
jgi:ribosome-binding factor A